MSSARELLWAAIFGMVSAWLACLIGTALGDRLPDAVDRAVAFIVGGGVP